MIRFHTAEIKRHKELARRDFIYKRKNRNRADSSAAGRQLQRNVESGRRQDFFRLVRPRLRFLTDRARRDLCVLEPAGKLHRGELTVEELLDQVSILAWERIADRPRHMSLDLWRTNLLQEALEQLIMPEPLPHLSPQARAEECRPAEPPQGELTYTSERL
jgi:hypothetical protein